jgi:hypothetical protein
MNRLVIKGKLEDLGFQKAGELLGKTHKQNIALGIRELVYLS